MAKRQKNMKAAAVTVMVPQNRQEANEAIADIGRLQRQRAHLAAAMNEAVAATKLLFEERARPAAQAIAERIEGLRIWAAANRDALTDSGKRKTAKLAAGEIRWRMTPMSVALRDVDGVIEALRNGGLTRFLRQKTEVNKEAILADPSGVDGIKGISLGQKEEFVVVPLETELEEVA